MPKGIKNARTNSDSRKSGATKLGAFVAKRKRGSITVQPDKPITSEPNAINDVIGDDTFDADNGIVTEAGDSRSGDRSGDGSGRDGRGRNGSGRSERNSGDSSDNTTSGKRGRRTKTAIIEGLADELDISLEEATKVYESQRAPKKVKSAELLPDGVEASVMLLSTVFEGGAELMAMASGRDYLKLLKTEGNALSKATLELLNSWPASVRKRFDKLMRIYVPYWNLASVITGIVYPRYQIFRMEKEMHNESVKQAKSENVRETESRDDSTEF